MEAKRRRHPTIDDIARLAGVSTATVDRVLNKRDGVRPITVQRVISAAAEIGYAPPAELEAARVTKPARLSVLLPAGNNRYIAALGRLLASGKEQLRPFNVECRVSFIKSFSPTDLAQALLKHAREADGVAFMALEHPAVREAVSTIAERGTTTITLISDLAGARRTAYVGLENRAAGRTAGYLIGRFLGHRAAKVAMIAGSLSYRAHEEREMGFLHLFEEMFPSVEVVGLREGHDESDQNYRQTRILLSQHPDLSAIYNIGGGAEGIGRALREARRDQEVVFVGHGLTADTRALLIDGTMDAVINQDPQDTMLKCGAILRNVLSGRDAMFGLSPVKSDIFIRENLPS